MPSPLPSLREFLSEPKVALPLRKDDHHTRALYTLATQRVTSWNASAPTAASVGVPTTKGPLETTDVIPGFVAVPTLDENGEKLPWPARAVFATLNKLPLMDDDTPWASDAAAHDFVAAAYPDVLPEAHIDWSGVSRDRATELMAFQGLGAHRLRPVDPATDPDGAAYVVDLSWMFGLPVREGLERYGAAAYFSADRRALRIYTAHDDRVWRPGEAGWASAAFRWRSALFTAVTVVDHLGTTHYLVANVMVRATREQLPPDHALRRLLSPHLFRTVDVNQDAALMLSSEGGLAHRTFGLTYAGVARLLLAGTEAVSLRPLDAALAEQRVDTLGDQYPYATDGRALWAVIHRYVTDWVALYLPGDAAVQDPAVRAWWRALVALAPNAGLAPLAAPAQLVTVVTQFIWMVTGYHAQVGNVVGYIRDPSFSAPKLRPGVDRGDRQTTVQMMNLAAVTGLAQPALLEDFTHLAPDTHREAAVALMRRFNAELRALSEEVAARNAAREVAFGTFDPSVLEPSVGV